VDFLKRYHHTRTGEKVAMGQRNDKGKKKNNKKRTGGRQLTKREKAVKRRMSHLSFQGVDTKAGKDNADGLEKLEQVRF